jgi:hypothetical protein
MTQKDNSNPTKHGRSVVFLTIFTAPPPGSAAAAAPYPPDDQKWPAPAMTIRRTGIPAWVSAIRKACDWTADRHVVIDAMDEQEPRAVAVDGGVADRRGLEIDAAVL